MRVKQIRFTVAQILALSLLGLSLSSRAETQDDQSAANLAEQFESAKIFWMQFEVARKIVTLGDTSVIPALTPWLSHEDRHIRCNAAFVVAGLGDDRGFEVISAVLRDRADRPEGQGTPGAKWSLREQVSSDRYYAVHMLGELKVKQAVPILDPLLQDEEVNYKVAWALGEIGDGQAISPLIEALRNKHPDVRVIAIQSLAKLGAKEALPRLHALLDDQEKTHYGAQVSVADAAKIAIATLEEKPQSGPRD